MLCLVASKAQGHSGAHAQRACPSFCSQAGDFSWEGGESHSSCPASQEWEPLDSGLSGHMIIDESNGEGRSKGEGEVIVQPDNPI